MLAYFKKLHPSVVFPEYAGPRLDGVLDFFKFSNIKTLSGFSRVGRALNAVGIPILLFKGGAMKFLRPNLQRPMGDVDFLVPPEKYAEAVAVAQKMGFKSKFIKPSPHSADCIIEDGRAIDIHCMTLKGKEAKYAGILDAEMFKRASKQRAFGVNFLLPCWEDLLFLTLVNLCNNIRYSESVSGRLFSIFDCDFFLKRDKTFDWDIVVDNARKTKTSYQIKLMIELINSVAPRFFPESLREKIPLTMEIKKEFDDLIFEWFLFEPLKRNKKTMHWNSVKKEGVRKILLYLFVKLKFIGLKILWKIRPAVFLISKYYQKKYGE
jgi:hypothetical protein